MKTEVRRLRTASVSLQPTPGAFGDIAHRLGRKGWAIRLQGEIAKKARVDVNIGGGDLYCSTLFSDELWVKRTPDLLDLKKGGNKQINH